jgi:tetratricopeptide (TPR) repeat protein
MTRKISCLVVTLMFIFTSYAQEMKNADETLQEADNFFMNEDFLDALPIYLQLYEQLPNNANLAYRIGACYLNIQGKKNLSVSYLEIASRKMSARYKEGTVNETNAPYDALYDLAVAYRINYQFDKAKDAFTSYKETLLPDDAENIKFIEHEINVCVNAKKLIEKPVDFTIENFGNLFNDEKSNFNPTISADGKSFVFMVSLKFYDAIMFSRLVNNKWTPPLNINPDLQSDGNLYVSCLSADGKTMLLLKREQENSDIYSSTFDGSKWSKSVKLNKNINTKYWESFGFISEDGNYLVFSSDRPGGFGGLDLYISKKQNGDWGPAVNLGPEINTPFNEDRPSLVNNGKTLFFASQDHDNIGGYDIFRSELQSNGIWSKPQNLGYPFNTPDDNIFFMPIGNGKSGFVSLYREAEGFGKEDIYKITFK